MKYPLLLLLAMASMVTFNSCTEDGEQRFEVPITISGFTVNQFVGVQTWQVFNSQVVTNTIEAELNDYGYSLANVKKIEPKNITLNITSAGDNFDNILYIESYVIADGDSVKVGYNTEIPNGVTSLSLNSQYSDITSIVKKPTFTFLVRAFNDGPFGPATGTVSFTVDVIAEK